VDFVIEHFSAHMFIWKNEAIKMCQIHGLFIVKKKIVLMDVETKVWMYIKRRKIELV